MTLALLIPFPQKKILKKHIKKRNVVLISIKLFIVPD